MRQQLAEIEEYWQTQEFEFRCYKHYDMPTLDTTSEIINESIEESTVKIMNMLTSKYVDPLKD